MATKVWTGKITPPAGYPPSLVELLDVFVDWFESADPVVVGVLASTNPDSAGNFSLTFDDTNIPPEALMISPPGEGAVYALTLSIRGPTIFAAFGPYDPDGNPL